MDTSEAGHLADTPALTPGAAGTVAGDWLIAALSASSDLAFTFDPFTIITWCNQACVAFLGFGADEVIGHSIAEFIHPDDLERAAEVVGLTAQGAFDEMPITPALYRGRHASGAWVNLELNGSIGPDGSMLIIARIGGDLVLTDRLLEAVSEGAPFEEQVDLVMQMGKWRHPLEGYAILYGEDDGQTHSVTWNLPPELYGEGGVAGPTPWSAAVAAGHEVVIDDLDAAVEDATAMSPELAAAATAAGFHGCLAMPIASPDQTDSACVVIWTTVGGPTTSGHRYAMSGMRRALTLVLQQRAQVRRLELAARVDGLTGTTSRTRFMDLLEALAEAAPDTARHAMLYIDLDGFKGVNDSLGHASGDAVLTETASRIVDLAPPGAVVTRLGGDEFAVLCPDETTPAEAERLAKLIIDAVSHPIDVGHQQVVIGASIGVAVGGGGDEPESVLDAADRALLTAKARGRGTWHLATPS